jgi:endonuclease/exonuclease/phosphatase family protein
VAGRGVADLRRGLRPAVAGCVVVCLLGCTTVLTGANAVGPRPAPPTSAAAPRVRVLQLNLCGSGFAACYTGRSTTEAAAVIHAEHPDLITLNEICRDDVTTLQRALADVAGDAVASAFQPALDERTGQAYRCRDGEQYGIGVVSRWAVVAGSSGGGGIYPIQDGQSSEGRAWLCLHVAATPAGVGVCTTHLAHTEREIAAGQCRYLFGTVIAEMRARGGAAPVVVAGDLNLPDGSPGLQSCLPAGSAPAGDNGVQHVVGTPGCVVDSSRTIDLHGASDHPALLVTLAFRGEWQNTLVRWPRTFTGSSRAEATPRRVAALANRPVLGHRMCRRGRTRVGGGPGGPDVRVFGRLRKAEVNRMLCRDEDGV